MNRKTLIFMAILLGCVLLGNYVIAPAIFEWLIPTIGRIGTTETTLTWQNGTVLTGINWGMVENETETPLDQLINVANTGNKPITLVLGASNFVNVLELTLTWDYDDSTITPGNSVLVQLWQNVTASDESYGYTTWINATAT